MSLRRSVGAGLKASAWRDLRRSLLVPSCVSAGIEHTLFQSAKSFDHFVQGTGYSSGYASIPDLEGRGFLRARCFGPALGIEIDRVSVVRRPGGLLRRRKGVSDRSRCPCEIAGTGKVQGDLHALCKFHCGQPSSLERPPTQSIGDHVALQQCRWVFAANFAKGRSWHLGQRTHILGDLRQVVVELVVSSFEPSYADARNRLGIEVRVGWRRRVVSLTLKERDRYS